MTLTWNNGNDWAGSPTDLKRHGGLTPFGRQVVRRMNELGMLVYVSHVSDQTFWDVIATSTRPVIASHSSCRALAHHPRNLSDDELRAVAKNGGVVGINFYPVFLDEHFRHQYEELRRRLKPETDAIRARYRGRPGESAFEVDKFVGEHAESLDVPSIDRLVDHRARGAGHGDRPRGPGERLRRDQRAAAAAEGRDIVARAGARPRGARLQGRGAPQDPGRELPARAYCRSVIPSLALPKE